MQTTITQETEIVIQGDQVFKRDSFLTPLENINTIIDKKMKEKNYTFLPLNFPPMLKKWVKGHWFGMDPTGKYLLCFTEVEYVPLKGARLDSDGCLVFSREGDDISHHQEFDEKWTPPLHHRLFVMTPWSTTTYSLQPPYLFMLTPNTLGPVTLKIPNVYDTGKICTGPSYKNRHDEEVSRHDNLPLHHIKYGLSCIHEAPSNSDLRQNDRLFMQWDEDKNQKTIPLHSSYWYTVSDIRIVEFTKWITANV